MYNDMDFFIYISVNSYIDALSPQGCTDTSNFTFIMIYGYNLSQFTTSAQQFGKKRTTQHYWGHKPLPV